MNEEFDRLLSHRMSVLSGQYEEFMFPNISRWSTSRDDQNHVVLCAHRHKGDLTFDLGEADDEPTKEQWQRITSSALNFLRNIR